MVQLNCLEKLMKCDQISHTYTAGPCITRGRLSNSIATLAAVSAVKAQFVVIKETTVFHVFYFISTDNYYLSECIKNTASYYVIVVVFFPLFAKELTIKSGRLASTAAPVTARFSAKF